MGSIISLGVGKLEIDWGKNQFFRNQSKLFLRDDIKPETYYYANNLQKTLPAYSRPLRSVKRRLELLGYSLAKCRLLYDKSVEEVPGYYDIPDLPFDVLGRVLSAADLQRMNLPVGESEDYNLGEFVARVIMADPEFTKTKADLASLTDDGGTFLENLDSYILLRLLCENPVNLDLGVVWRFQDVLDSGWISERVDDLYEGLDDSDRYLIVTEGSSDSSILKASLPLVAADVADFFSFIDMTDNYPFTGTGNLFRFCQGLATIRIQNKILVILDADTAGVETFERIRKIPLPASMHIACLPPLDEFRKFKTMGPSGQSEEDVNGKALAIECFLDLKRDPNPPAAIRWTSFNSAMGAYQGELIDKQKYTRAFFDAAGKDVSYDLSKLAYLWEHILAECSA
jgi:hypothetical protein